MDETIKQILMRRDGLNAAEADARIREAIDALLDYLESSDSEGAENICEEYFGLEPDYLEELL